VEYHELSGRADFNDSFLAVLQFPELDSLGLENNFVDSRGLEAG
jgi:hypothetical protein